MLDLTNYGKDLSYLYSDALELAKYIIIKTTDSKDISII